MKLLDLNILLYATNTQAPQHARAARWLAETLRGEEPVALPWVVVLGFLRLATNARVFAAPLTVAQACATVDAWLAQPAVTPLAPGDDHWRVLRRLLLEAGTAGNLTTDAHLAALAIEHAAELCSTDSDFARFRSLQWLNPLAATR